MGEDTCFRLYRGLDWLYTAMIEESKSTNTTLDSRQSRLQSYLRTDANTLEHESGIRYNSFKNVHFILEPRNTELAQRSKDQILDLKDIVGGVANDVPSMSTSSGGISEEQSLLYLEEEILRATNLGILDDWNERFKKHIKYIRENFRGRRFPCSNREQDICNSTIAILEDHISDLTEQEECMRACLILSEIYKQRSSLSKAFLLTPVNSVTAVAATIASTIAVLGVSAGITIGASTTGVQYAHQGYKNMRRSSNFSAPMRSSISLITEYAKKDRQFVQCCLVSAGIHESIFDVIGYDVT